MDDLRQDVGVAARGTATKKSPPTTAQRSAPAACSTSSAPATTTGLSKRAPKARYDELASDIYFRADVVFHGPLADSRAAWPRVSMVYNTGIVTSFRSWRFSGGAPLVAAVVLCLGTILSWNAIGPEVLATLTTADWSQVDQGANGDEHPLNGSHLALPGEEAKDGDKGPVNAELLTALLLTLSFGMPVGWLLANGRGQEAFCSLGVASCLSLIPRQNSPSLGVFRL